MPENGGNNRMDTLAVASPVMAAVAALFLSGCVAFAYLTLGSSVAARGQLLLKAGVLAFVLGEILALVLGIFGLFRVRRRGGLKGLPEALLGILSACLLAVTVIILL